MQLAAGAPALALSAFLRVRAMCAERPSPLVAVAATTAVPGAGNACQGRGRVCRSLHATAAGFSRVWPRSASLWLRTALCLPRKKKALPSKAEEDHYTGRIPALVGL